MTDRTFRWLFVILYAFAATLYHDASLEFPILLTYVLGCGGAYVIAANLPTWLRTISADVSVWV